MIAVYNRITRVIEANSALFETNSLAPIAHIDRYKGQYVNPELHNDYPLPALFLRFSIDWGNRDNLEQHGTLTVEAHLELDSLGESYNYSPDRGLALSDYLYRDILNGLLHGLDGEAFTPLTRVSTTEDDEPTDTNVTIVAYQCELFDDSASRLKKYVRVPLDDMASYNVGFGG